MKINQLPKISWSKSIWFFDIDDTLSDTSDVSSLAAEGIKKVFKVKFGDDIATAVKNQVNEYYDLMLLGNRIKSENDWKNISGGKKYFDNLFKAVSDCQQGVIKDYGAPKKWSREVLVKLSADKLGIKVSPELIYEAVDAYWLELSKITAAFSDAIELIKVIKTHNRPIYLITSSDARLKMLPNGQFIYNPVYSEALKRQRIELLREKGINFNLLIIGDPEDKPHKDFFEKCIKGASDDIGIPINLSDSIIAGDQFDNDLKTPKEMGFGLVIFINRKTRKLEVVDKHQINTDNLLKVTDYLSA